MLTALCAAPRYEWWVPPVRIAPPLLLTRLLTDLLPYLTRRGDGSGGELLSWYHRQFLEAAQAWLFGGSNGQVIRKRRHRELADYFSGTWAGKAKPYNDALKTCVQRPQFFPGESAAERNVPRQPLALTGDPFATRAQYTLNTRRIHELVWHLIKSNEVDRAVVELMSPEYIAAKFAVGAGAELMLEYALFVTACKEIDRAACNELIKCKVCVCSCAPYVCCLCILST